MKLTILKSATMADWYTIERAEHDGREWWESTSTDVAVLRCSARISDADIEGRASEMRNIAVAIEKGVTAEFKRCAVDATREPVKFWSPRNSRTMGECSKTEAKALAEMIRERLT